MSGGGRWIHVTSTFLFIYLEHAPQPARESAPPHNCVQDPRGGAKACVQGVNCVLNMQSKGLIWSRKGVRVGGGVK